MCRCGASNIQHAMKAHTDSRDSAVCMSLPLPRTAKSTSLQALLDKFTTQQRVSKGFRCPVKCAGAQRQGSALRQCLLTRVSRTLLVQLGRRVKDTKNNMTVQIENVHHVDVWQGEHEQTKKTQMRLKSIVCHHGDNVESGHYTTTIVCDDGRYKTLDNKRAHYTDTMPPNVRGKRTFSCSKWVRYPPGLLM